MLLGSSVSYSQATQSCRLVLWPERYLVNVGPSPRMDVEDFLISFIQVRVNIVLPNTGRAINVKPPIADSSGLIEDRSVRAQKLVMPAIGLTIVPDLNYQLD